MKRIYFTMLCLSFIMICSACSKKEEKDVDVKALSNSLLSELTYQDELSEIDLTTAQMIYAIEENSVAESAFYVSSGATAEEIAVIKCQNSDEAKKVKEALELRVQEQTESFRDYVPEELEKLGKAVIKEKGSYVILSISNDPDQAKSIIDKAF